MDGVVVALTRMARRISCSVHRSGSDEKGGIVLLICIAVTSLISLIMSDCVTSGLMPTMIL